MRASHARLAILSTSGAVITDGVYTTFAPPVLPTHIAIASLSQAAEVSQSMSNALPTMASEKYSDFDGNRMAARSESARC